MESASTGGSGAGRDDPRGVRRHRCAESNAEPHAARDGVPVAHGCSSDAHPNRERPHEHRGGIAERARHYGTHPPGDSRSADLDGDASGPARTCGTAGTH